jgi:type III secretion protein L
MAMSVPRSPGKKIIRREDAQNWIDGYRFMEEARHAADQLLCDARTAYEEAKKSGFEQGRGEGAIEAAAVVADTTRKADRYLASLESQVAELALSIVEKVLGTFDDGAIVARTAQQAIASFRHEKMLTVRVSPQVADLVQRAIAAWSANEADVPPLVIEADPAFEPRQCVIVSEFAVVDASLDAQLNVVRQMCRRSDISMGRS